MRDILIKAFSFILIIVLGNVLKRIGVFGVKDYKIVTKIIMNITLPCALITGFANFKMDTSMLFIVLFGFLANIIMSTIGYILASVPFDTYLLMLIITVTGIKLPQVIYSVTSNLSAGNAFLSMLMIGMVFECNLKREQLFKVVSMLSIRYLSSFTFALIIYYLIPFSIEIKHILIILVFGPISVLSPVFTGYCKADEGLAV